MVIDINHLHSNVHSYIHGFDLKTYRHTLWFYSESVIRMNWDCCAVNAMTTFCILIESHCTYSLEPGNPIMHSKTTPEADCNSWSLKLSEAWKLKVQCGCLMEALFRQPWLQPLLFMPPLSIGLLLSYPSLCCTDGPHLRGRYSLVVATCKPHAKLQEHAVEVHSFVTAQAHPR